MMRCISTISLVAWTLLVSGLVTAQDKVEYIDRANKNVKAIADGTIQKETVRGIEIKPKGNNPVKEIPAGDILDITYAPPTGVIGSDMRAPFNAEDKVFSKTLKAEDKPKRIEEALTAYDALMPKLAASANVERFFKYRRAMFLVRLADEDPGRMKDALDAVNLFKDANPECWEYVSTIQTLARLQESQQDQPGALKTYDEVTGREDLPVEMRAQAGFSLVRMFVRANQVDKAEDRLEKLTKLIPPNDPLSPRVQVNQIVCKIKKGQPGDAEKQLKSILSGPGDELAKGQAANTLGDLYVTAKKPEDAFWQYLMVDVLFNKDPEEHAKALYNLSRLFKEVRNDDARAKTCRERLLDPSFRGLEYQRLAQAEQPGSGS